MPQYWDSIPDHLAEWTLHQSLFFTASAPLTGSHINISPKGLPTSTFTIFSPNSCAYIDATGSGCETLSHVYENGRVTIMFCSFDTSPRIVRFFCTGRVVEWDDGRFAGLVGKMGKGGKVDGARAVVCLEVWKVQNSCGFGVPCLSASPTSDIDQLEGTIKAELKDRKTMGHWASKQVAKNTLKEFQVKYNTYSLDGLPGLKTALRDSGRLLWVERVKAWARRMGSQREALTVGVLLGIVAMFFLQMMGMIG